ncbi:hypothetical protein GI584_05460 [Gracilibacillus salitolerans]|uniref:Uncharacterized protein n=1 Tax=Gracilibacillus salitolerans TaxID=2663022 RepID=A0A5Q2TJF6_9BACI|nr:hypothetical protein [Gracilibacillus salitolerans]QGH33498.1 hypothetical protein GI584_05460 [Gracilibacillus salitolerans]
MNKKLFSMMIGLVSLLYFIYGGSVLSAQDANLALFDFKDTAANPTPEIEDLPAPKDAYADYFHTGAALAPSQILGKHAELLQKHYNMIVAENVMTAGIFSILLANLKISILR